jgi:phosphate-selective porin OprO and OprP
VYTGHGENYQASYLFKRNYEITGRYSRVRPKVELYTFEPEVEQFTLGTTKYIKGHRLKLQTDLIYEMRNWLGDAQPDVNRWQLRFQIEAGI